jgi:hypothetical protein
MRIAHPQVAAARKALQAAAALGEADKAAARQAAVHTMETEAAAWAEGQKTGLRAKLLDALQTQVCN